MADARRFSCRSWDLGRVDAYAALILKGVRPVALICFPNSCLAEALHKIREEHGLVALVRPRKGKNHTDVYMYRQDHPHLTRVIPRLLALEDHFLGEWCLGKLFGYGETEIGAYLATRRDGVVEASDVATSC